MNEILRVENLKKYFTKKGMFGAKSTTVRATDDVSFSLKQFQNKREKVCKEKNISITIPSRGLASLLQKGIILKEGNIYSIHYKLIPYMRLRAVCDYATVIHEVRLK